MAQTNSPRFRDLTGQVFTYLTVVEQGVRDSGSNMQWLCRCQCGVEKLVRGFQLVNGSTKSCGCMSRKMMVEKTATHNRSGDKVYKVWSSMWSRCTNPNDASYKHYKDRTPPERWKSFENFISDMGERPSDLHSLERVKNDLPYGPDNCVWATRVEQNNNSGHNRNITYNGVTKNVTEWASHTGIKVATLRARLDVFKWPTGEALGYEPHINGNTVRS